MRARAFWGGLGCLALGTLVTSLGCIALFARPTVNALVAALVASPKPTRDEMMAADYSELMAANLDRWERRGEYCYVYGTVKNSGHMTIGTWKVTAKLYDRDGAVIHSASTSSSQQIEPSASQYFDIMTRCDARARKAGVYVQEARLKQ